MKKGIIVLIVVGILFAIFAPILFTQNWTCIDFAKKGQIGDTIGGITAPIIGILSILLLYFTLKAQMDFDKKQTELSSDEQFKSTFFNLLQVQRDIIEKIAGDFKYLGQRVNEEYEKNAVRGLDFFKEAEYQLSLIYEALDNEKFIDHYDQGRAYDTEVFLQKKFCYGDDAPMDIQTGQEIEINKDRKVHRVAYTNDMYGISEKIHTCYREMSEDKKIGLGYAYFFYKYENVGHYFRHIYQILKFLKTSEDEKLNSLRKPDKEKAIHSDFKKYAQFIQAQMSTDELLLLFYNSFTFKKAQQLIIYYDLLENLTVQNLIKKEHNCKSELKLKNKDNLFLDLIRRR